MNIEKIKATALRAVKCDHAEAPVFSPETVLELISRLESADTCRETLVSTIQTNNSVIKSMDDKLSDLLVKLEAAEMTAMTREKIIQLAREFSYQHNDATASLLNNHLVDFYREAQAEAFKAAAELCSNNFDMTGHYLAYRIREMAKGMK